MFKVPGHFPPQAIERFPRQAARVNHFQSCQQEMVFITFSDAQLAAYIAGPPSHPASSIFVQDFNQILPYTTLEFRMVSGGGPVPPSTPYRCNLFTSTGQSNLQVRDQLIAQINAYATTMGAQHKNMQSLRAVIGPTLMPGDYSLKILMPFGMLGAASFTFLGPISASVVAGFPGVDNPLIYGILGKRRHFYVAKNPYRHDYYGTYGGGPG